MSIIKLYSEVIVNEKAVTTSFTGRTNWMRFQTLLSMFFFNRNYHIERRIMRIRKETAASKSWGAMTDEEHISHIYKTMAEEKAIERMLRLMDK